MRIPNQAAPVMRNFTPVMVLQGDGIMPQVHWYCGLCESSLESVVRITGCSPEGLGGFTAACMTAIGWIPGVGVTACTAAEVTLAAICLSQGTDWVDHNIKKVAKELCHKMKLC